MAVWKRQSPDVAAHERRTAAAQAAIDGNFAIECDIQLTSDGEAMVHHDNALGRLTEGSGALLGKTAAELKTIRFKNTPERMMTLGDLCALVAALTSRGLTHLFVEGGGVTVGGFLTAGLIDRLHLAVAPLLLGSGIPTLALDGVLTPDQGVRFPLVAHRLGEDMLFDCAIDRRRPAGA